MERSTNPVESVVILGGGPAASALATFLAREGLDVLIFYEENDAPMLVGESLVPGVVSILRDLGVESDLQSFSQRKPGATIRLADETRLDFVFEDIPGPHPGYSFNVLRRPFNRLLRSQAEQAGAEFVEERAEVEADDGRIELKGPTRERYRSSRGGSPDLVVDATGRARVLASLLNLPDQRGPRTDTALFTHFDRVEGTSENHIYTQVFEYGWSWQIPLPERCSFGLVVDSDHLDRFGSTPRERLEGYIEGNNFLSNITEGAERIEPVLEFSNYQWTARKLYGSNWVLLGDAGGFIDPIFSTGLYLALRGASELADGLLEEGLEFLPEYQNDMRSTYDNWQYIIESLYDGRLLALFKMGDKISEGSVEEAISPALREDIGKIFTGLAGESPSSFESLKLLLNNGLGDLNPDNFRIKSIE